MQTDTAPRCENKEHITIIYIKAVVQKKVTGGKPTKKLRQDPQKSKPSMLLSSAFELPRRHSQPLKCLFRTVQRSDCRVYSFAKIRLPDIVRSVLE